MGPEIGERLQLLSAFSCFLFTWLSNFEVRVFYTDPLHFSGRLVSEFLANFPGERKGGDAKKRKRFSVEQVVAVLKLNFECPVQTESQDQDHGKNLTVEETVTEEESEQVQERVQLQEENTSLNHLVADLTLDKVMLPDVLSKRF